MRRAAIAAIALWLAGCSCQEPPAAPVEGPVAAPAPPPVADALPSASRSDLPAATPAITITVRAASFLVSNRALVASWPEAERRAVGQTRPLGDADYPVVEREVDDASTQLVIPALHDAMADVAAIEHARAAIVHAAGSTVAFAVRAGPDVPFGRVLSAIYAAGITGFNQPRLVLASPGGERELRLVLPSVDEEGPDPAVRAEAEAAAEAALAAIEGRPLPPPVDAGVAPRIGRTAVMLGPDGVTVRRGLVRFAPGCTEPAPEGTDTPTIPTAAITPSVLDACVVAAGVDRGLVFGAPSTTPYGDAVALLETLAAHGSVALSASLAE